MKQGKKLFDSELQELWQDGMTEDQLNQITVTLEDIGSIEAPPALLSKILRSDYREVDEEYDFWRQLSRPLVAGVVAAFAVVALFFSFSLSTKDSAHLVKQGRSDLLVTLMLDDEAPFDDIFVSELILLEELS